MSPFLVVGVDASRNRSGGAVQHVRGLLSEVDPRRHGIREVHVWTYPSLAQSLPNHQWLVKHTPSDLTKSLWRQMYWQRSVLPREARAAGCGIVFNTDAGSISPFRPAVTLSQDLLSFESGEMRRYGLSIAMLRLVILRYVQARSLRESAGAIFLTDYARRTIERTTGQLHRTTVISHGIDESFRPSPTRWADSRRGTNRCLYVSNVAPYKHQRHVVDAVAHLRDLGVDVSLALVGAGTRRAERRLSRQLAAIDPNKRFLTRMGFVEHDKLPKLYESADIFVFASSCENLPITLLEAMASGIPIACSDRGPMPEVLGDAGVFFDPEDSDSIAAALKLIIDDPPLRERMVARAKARSQLCSWSLSADATWRFVADTYRMVTK